MWLDLKNLTSNNVNFVLAELNRLVEQYSVDKSRLIVESKDYISLGLLKENGYYVSYYVPYDKPGRLDDNEYKAAILELQKVVDSGKVSAISFPGWWYESIKSDLNRNIDLLTWEHRKIRAELFFYPYCRDMLKDKRVKVILIKDKGKYHK